MTVAVLITDFFDFDIEKEKFTFSIGVPSGYFLVMPELFLLLPLPTDSLSNLITSLEIFPLASEMIPISSPLAPFVRPSLVSALP